MDVELVVTGPFAAADAVRENGEAAADFERSAMAESLGRLRNARQVRRLILDEQEAELRPPMLLGQLLKPAPVPYVLCRIAAGEAAGDGGIGRISAGFDVKAKGEAGAPDVEHA